MGGFFYKTLFASIDLTGKSVFFEIYPGESSSQIFSRLETNNIGKQSLWLNLYFRFSESATKIKAGEYLLSGRTNLISIINLFISGKVHLHAFTIIEGWTVKDLQQQIDESDLFIDNHEAIEWINYSGGYNNNESMQLSEGMFLPETYMIPRKSKVSTLLRRAHEALLSTLAEEWLNRTIDIPLKSPYDGLILASIIEKETAVSDERAKIASVFIERLKINMRLQTDPTIIYGLGEIYNGDLTRANMRIDTPYNTYMRSGLPPTPIALPGKASIKAAFNPANEKNIYFVATGNNDGRHTFSTNKNDHDLAVQKYLDRIKNQSIN